jgi:hypothetical protein
MDTKQLAQKFIQLFREARRTRKRGPRKYGAKTFLGDGAGVRNPNNHLKGPQGRLPGYGRDKLGDVPPMKTSA